MNGLHDNLIKGTLGELLVQIRLLQFGVQAAAPLKDTGNDLIAVRGSAFRAIQVKTTQDDTYDLPGADRKYHVLAAVRLVGENSEVQLDASRVYLIPRGLLNDLPRRFSEIENLKATQNWVDQLFPPPAE